MVWLHFVITISIQPEGFIKFLHAQVVFELIVMNGFVGTKLVTLNFDAKVLISSYIKEVE